MEEADSGQNGGAVAAGLQEVTTEEVETARSLERRTLFVGVHLFALQETCMKWNLLERSVAGQEENQKA